MDAAAFLKQYGFDLGGQSSGDWVRSWEQRFPKSWVSSALVEALYRGRYKARSVEQLLNMWKSRGCPCVGFNLDFGREVWPDGLERLQIGLEQGALHSSAAAIRSYAFESFATVKKTAVEQNNCITVYPLCKQLRREALPAKLQDLLHV
ncbi:hypothetical protein [Synechococcus sp. PCC 7336]|uniref:hypothetical protein n=1 Tax=Synechococcus sp. PCC 7336 TaxID=195250 RepID=UPI000345C62D|nr:hypothetical protein [Synechococcus sp. PCC 7336]